MEDPSESLFDSDCYILGRTMSPFIPPLRPGLLGLFTALPRWPPSGPTCQKGLHSQRSSWAVSKPHARADSANPALPKHWPNPCGDRSGSHGLKNKLSLLKFATCSPVKLAAYRCADKLPLGDRTF